MSYIGVWTSRFEKTRVGFAEAMLPHNMGVIRHVAMNLLKRETSKISIRKKRIRAALNDDFRDKILMGTVILYAVALLLLRDLDSSSSTAMLCHGGFSFCWFAPLSYHRTGEGVATLSHFNFNSLRDIPPVGQIPHAELLKSVARRVSDGPMLGWVKAWLEMAVEEDDGKGDKRRTNRAPRERTRRDLPLTRTSAWSQSISFNRRLATSPARRASRARSSTMARSRSPTGVARSHDAMMRSISSRGR